MSEGRAPTTQSAAAGDTPAIPGVNTEHQPVPGSDPRSTAARPDQPAGHSSSPGGAPAVTTGTLQDVDKTDLVAMKNKVSWGPIGAI
jgi:hypothetical protein